MPSTCRATGTWRSCRRGDVPLPATPPRWSLRALRSWTRRALHRSPPRLVRIALDSARDPVPTILDVGAGTGHHLAAVLDALPDAHGIAFDASRAALRHAARAHPRIAAVAGDVWHEVPLRDASVSLLMNVFAPRNPSEFARIMGPGGTLIVVTPATGHLRELAMLHPMRLHPRKRRQLQRQLRGDFDPAGVRRIAWTLHLTARQAGAVVRMGPAAHHLTPADEQRLCALPESLSVGAAVDLHLFRRVLR